LSQKKINKDVKNIICLWKDTLTASMRSF
jgi:hypothetical protein